MREEEEGCRHGLCRRGRGRSPGQPDPGAPGQKDPEATETERTWRRGSQSVEEAPGPGPHKRGGRQRTMTRNEREDQRAERTSERGEHPAKPSRRRDGEARLIGGKGCRVLSHSSQALEGLLIYRLWGNRALKVASRESRSGYYIRQEARHRLGLADRGVRSAGELEPTPCRTSALWRMPSEEDLEERGYAG